MSSAASRLSFPLTLKRSDAWKPDQVLLIEAENTKDYMINLIVCFRGAGNEVKVKLGLFPHWRCVFPLALSIADGSVLFIPRTPGRFKATVIGANIQFADLEEIHVRTSVGAEADVVCLQAQVQDAGPIDYPVPSEPLVDSLQQWTGRNWPGKARSLDELKTTLRTELAGAAPAFPQQWSQYGGWLEKSFDKTGYFHSHHDGSRWWLVDPEGYAFWSIGVNCIRPSVETLTAGVESVFEYLPDKTAYADCWSGTDEEPRLNAQGALLRDVFGDGWKPQWMELSRRRMRRYAVNTIANWSDAEFIATARTPYVFTMKQFPRTSTCIFRDFPDVFADEYQYNCREFAEQLTAHINDQFMIGYFMANEPQWAFVSGFDVGAQLLQSDLDLASRRTFIDRLKKQYVDITSLNTAWGSDFASFDNFNRAVDLRPFPKSKKDSLAFTTDAVDRYMRMAIEACRAIDPHHMNLGCRWAWIHSDYQLAAADALDAFSLNAYQMKPDPDLFNDLSERCGKPIMIGEFHIGALDRGLPSGGLRTTQSMAESVAAYRYYMEHAATLPSLVGAHYFLWNDQHVMGRADGENMQIGLHDITARPYAEWEAMTAQVNPRLYPIRAGQAKPFATEPTLVPEGGLAWQ